MFILNMEGGSDFSHKKGGVGKIAGGLFLKKGVSHILIPNNPFECNLFQVFGVCV